MLVGEVIFGLLFDVVSNSFESQAIRIAGNVAFFIGVAMLIVASYREKKHRDSNQKAS